MRLWLLSMGAIALFLLVSYFVLTRLVPLILPFVLATLLAEILAPLVDWLAGDHRRRWSRLPRSVAAGLVVLLLTAGLIAGVVLGVGRLAREVQGITAALPQHYQTLSRLMADLTQRVGALSENLPVEVQPVVLGSMDRLQGMLMAALKRLPDGLAALLALPGLLANTVIMIVATFFILRDRRAFGEFLIGLFPAGWHDGIRQVKRTVWASAIGVVKAVVVLVTITGILTMIGLTLIGAPYAVSVGLLVAVADILPIVGPGAVFLPWAGYHFALGNVWFAVKLLVLYGVVTAIRQVLEPKLVGDQTGLHPLTILFTIYIGFQVFGGLGFLFGPFLAILLKAMIQSGLLPMVGGRPAGRGGA